MSWYLCISDDTKQHADLKHLLLEKTKHIDAIKVFL